jgi:iron uptake system EfeUOB component EfeO/EfeM
VRAALPAIAAAIGALTLGASAAAAAPERITFGNVTCAPAWPPPNPGRDTFLVANGSNRVATVYLFRADSGRIIATIKRLKAGASQRLTAKLTPGPYAWGCDLRGYPEHVSEADKVVGHRQAGGTGPPIVPTNPQELLGALVGYRHYVAAKIETLAGEVAALRAAIGSRDTAASQSAWLTAHETWLEIGQDDGAYGAFGNLGREIDGTSAGLVGGVANGRFTGFHKVELDLWTRHDLASAGTDAAVLAKLIAKVSKLRVAAVFPVTKLALTNWTLRCHEVLEDALRDSLTGDDDYGSHTDLQSVVADVAATRELLGLLAPLLRPRKPALVGTARRQLTRLDRVIATSDHDGTAIATLPRITRERVDAAAGAALETLAPIPDLLRIGNT